MLDVEIERRPEPSGLLVVPPRRPPTAIGAATTPPPSDPYPRLHSKTRRIALGLLAILLAISTLSLAWSPTAPRLTMASGVAAATTDVALQAVSGRVHPWQEIVGPAVWRLVQQATAWPLRSGGRRAHEALRLSAQADLDCEAPQGTVRRSRGTSGRSHRCS